MFVAAGSFCGYLWLPQLELLLGFFTCHRIRSYLQRKKKEEEEEDG